MKINVLAADDDPNIRALLRLVLESEQYHVLEAADGQAAADILQRETVHIAIVDVMMPVKDGWALCSEIRTSYDIPVILLTALGELEDKETGFAAGTDDYMVKPFEPKELLFRMKALLRRYQIVSDSMIRFPHTVIDRLSYTVMVNGQEHVLPRKEFELLAQMAAYPGRIFTRDQLLDWIWGSNYEGDARTIDVHIKRLRERFHDSGSDFHIVTIRGLGYKLEVRDA
ncbi:response regulator transcription factor [Paenibacillus apiarius]|uniref:Heme response regulator HssR n=1 Tax=Paenibacillus apiarius TaxID=46240 RepID=A0ABT4E060_9BACL|nr:response regulator transcription factor [Paenibacillus apiarius]MBN3525499.1 response regulator transcription factor [Paenibacillus apiarius]MCY9512652.1 response regulator transcription factor [Paenibacillus apiarius]MCY9522992.1 response regulator transcription factor [Paenibacillus apiarius]MCY9550746.1 response regulator transcription factor [Paenibacillus apiarius]MCY9556570.1 response regulator transcription factor [Paenibacillus apiarius]